MDIQAISAIIFVILLSLFLLTKRKQIKLQKIFFPLLYFYMYRTKIGINWMDRIAKKFPRQLNYISYFAIFIGFLGMVMICYALLSNIYTLLTQPAAAPGVGLVLPFAVKGAFYVPFFYWILSIFIIAVIHEFSHGVIARAYNLKVKSSGLAFLCVLLPVVPAAFVEPDEKQLKKKPGREQLFFFAAGPFSNILLAFIVLGISALVIAPVINSMVEFDGVAVTGVMESYPAELAGIKEGEIIQGIDSTQLGYLSNFSNILQNKAAGEVVLIKTDKAMYSITLAENPENKSKGYLGVYVQQSKKTKDSFKERFGGVIPDIILWLAGLAYWLYVLNLGIGLFNLVPIGPLDGGRMLGVALLKYFKKETADKIWKFTGAFFLTLVLINLAFAFIR